MKSFGPKKISNSMHGSKSAILAIFQTGPGWPCTVIHQESLTGFQKIFLLRVPMNSQQCWKAKLERALFSMFQYCKITVCFGFAAHCTSDLLRQLVGRSNTYFICCRLFSTNLPVTWTMMYFLFSLQKNKETISQIHTFFFHWQHSC